MARTYGLALVGALLSTFTITPVLTSFLLPERVDEAEDGLCACLTQNLSARPAMVA